MNIFRFLYLLFKSFVKVELSYVFTINLFTIAETARKSELSYKAGVFSLVGDYLRPSNNYRQLIKHKCCCFDTDNLLRFTKLVKCFPEF